jgi:hypothetical protein
VQLEFLELGFIPAALAIPAAESEHSNKHFKLRGLSTISSPQEMKLMHKISIGKVPNRKELRSESENARKRLQTMVDKEKNMRENPPNPSVINTKEESSNCAAFPKLRSQDTHLRC